MTTATDTRSAARLAAPAPRSADDDTVAEHADTQLDAQRHQLCEGYARWRARCRLWGPPPLAAGTLGRLTRVGRAGQGDGPDAACSSLLSALHMAVVSQPIDALDRQVFELYYVYRVRNIKAVATELGVGRRHFYRLLVAFRARVCRAAAEIEAANLVLSAGPVAGAAASAQQEAA